MGRLSLVTAPAEEPVSLVEAQEHLRIDSTAQDALLNRLIQTAREAAESETRRALITQTWDWIRDGFPEDDEQIDLPKPNLASITSVTYLDANNQSTVWASTNYRATAPSGPRAEPGRLALGYGISWPITYDVTDAVTIRFVAGYGAAAAVPAAIKSAMLLLIAEMYERRTEQTVGTIVTPNTLAAARLLAPYRVLRW